jgi:hypothetical protein
MNTKKTILSGLGEPEAYPVLNEGANAGGEFLV